MKLLSSKNCRKERVTVLRKALSCLGQEIADEELTALLCGDIPIFHCFAKSRNLYSGEKCIMPDYFPHSILDNVRYRIAHMTDLAEFREYKQEKFLVITGRVKNMIILPNGENVSPEELESIFYQNALVKDCLVSQMTINENLVIGIEILPFMSAFADCTADEIEIRLQSVVDEINTQLPTYKRISKLVVRTEDFKRSRAMKILREQ